MALQPGRRTAGGRGFLDGTGDNLRLSVTEGDQCDPAGFKDRRHAHREGALRDLREIAEEDRVILPGHGVKVHPAGPALGGGGRFVETDMAGAADTEDLKIDAAGRTDGRFILGAMTRRVFGHPVRDMDVSRGDIEMPEEILLHEEPVGLRMVRAEALVFVEVERDDRAEAQAFFAMQADQLRVEGQGRGARRQTQHRRLARFRA